MKTKYFVSIVIAIFITTGISSCSDFLETTPLTEFSEASVFSDPILVETFINHIYFRLDEPLTDGRNSSNVVDEGHYRGNAGSLQFNRGQITLDVIPASPFRRYRGWNDLYKTIRFCNIFFNKVEEVPFDNVITDGKTLKERMTGEVHFLRAYLYFFLISTYGGVPIIEEVYELDSEFEKARNSWQECVDFVVSECDKAAALLPVDNTGANLGRATRGAALALKSRILLYAASDLYNTIVFPDYANQELIRYTSGDRTARWQTAKQAAKAVIDMGKYSLYKAIPAQGDDIAQNITDIFLNPYNQEEDIFFKFFTRVMSQNYTLYTSPNGYHGWGTNAPIGNFIDVFEMFNGTKFDWNNPQHAALPYANREPRFYANVLYNEAPWIVRADDAKTYDPDNKIQTGRWEIWDPSLNATILRYGVDTRSGNVEDWNGSYTGYYCRKYLDPTVGGDPNLVKGIVTWRWSRYAEILLNYAEACIELGEDDEARTYINMVRTRAGLPGLTESGEALRQRYRNERRIELCFEDHRYYDVRRWVIGPEAYNITVTHAEIVYKLQSDNSTATVPEIKHEPLEDWEWNNKAYFLPILRDEVNRNPLLINNPGY